MHRPAFTLSLFAILISSSACLAQTTQSDSAANLQRASAQPMQVLTTQTRFASGISEPAVSALAPSSTAALRTYHDPSWKVSVDFPQSWTFAEKDGEISTFHLDARSAPHTTRLRAVAAIPENPYPESTFSGAYVYLSVIPKSTAVSCAAQIAAPGQAAPIEPNSVEIAGIPFNHGHDEQKHICVTDRDEVYTTLHKGACYRFDLAINNFCGGEVSSVKYVSPQELENVRARMEAILSTVRFDQK